MTRTEANKNGRGEEFKISKWKGRICGGRETWNGVRTEELTSDESTTYLERHGEHFRQNMQRRIREAGLLYTRHAQRSAHTHTIASTPLQYLSHIDRNFGWPDSGSQSENARLGCAWAALL